MATHRKFISDTTVDDLIKERAARSPGFKAKVDARVRELGIARQVKALRQRRGLGQDALAKKAGTGQAVIARLESGRVPKFDLLSRVADALNADLSVNLRGRPTPRRPARKARSSRKGAA